MTNLDRQPSSAVGRMPAAATGRTAAGQEPKPLGMMRVRAADRDGHIVADYEVQPLDDGTIELRLWGLPVGAYTFVVEESAPTATEGADDA